MKSVICAVIECHYVIEYTIIVSINNIYKLYLHSALCGLSSGANLHASGGRLLPRSFMPGILGSCNSSFLIVMFHKHDPMANPIILYTLQACINVYNC